MNTIEEKPTGEVICKHSTFCRAKHGERCLHSAPHNPTPTTCQMNNCISGGTMDAVCVEVHE